MTEAERELQAIKHKLTEWQWKVALAIFKIPPGRLITYRSLSILATSTDASRAAANLRQKLIRLLGVRTQVPLHRIAKKGDLGAKADWPDQKLPRLSGRIHTVPKTGCCVSLNRGVRSPRTEFGGRPRKSLADQTRLHVVCVVPAPPMSTPRPQHLPPEGRAPRGSAEQTCCYPKPSNVTVEAASQHPTPRPQTRASDLDRPSAGGTGTARPVKQDPGRMIYFTGIHLISAACLSKNVGPPHPWVFPRPASCSRPRGTGGR